MTTRVGADAGGTLTDVVVASADGSPTFAEALSTPPAHARAVADSGGAGRPRGGLATGRARRCLAPDTGAGHALRPADAPGGRARGRGPGGSSSTMVRGGGETERLPPLSAAARRPGDVFVHRLAGGGGRGDPAERDDAARARDLRHGKNAA